MPSRARGTFTGTGHIGNALEINDLRCDRRHRSRTYHDCLYALRSGIVPPVSFRGLGDSSPLRDDLMAGLGHEPIGESQTLPMGNIRSHPTHVRKQMSVNEEFSPAAACKSAEGNC
jgi:hypothetical protein